MEITPTMLGKTKKAKLLQKQLDDFVDTMNKNKPSNVGPFNIYLHSSDIKWILEQVNKHREAHKQQKMQSLALCTWRGAFIRSCHG